jgi:hypothetical protein
MSTTRETWGPDPRPGRVEILVRGHLEARWSDWLDGLTLTRRPDGTTLIEGPVVDQAALFGVIDRLRDMALPLMSVVHQDRPAGTPDAVAPAPPAAAVPPTKPATTTRPRSQP